MVEYIINSKLFEWQTTKPVCEIKNNIHAKMKNADILIALKGAGLKRLKILGIICVKHELMGYLIKYNQHVLVVCVSTFFTSRTTN